MPPATLSLARGSAWRFRLGLVALGVALVLSVIIAASVGAVSVSLRSVAGIVLDRMGAWPQASSWSATDAPIVHDVR
jgi:hypothetical protein